MNCNISFIPFSVSFIYAISSAQSEKCEKMWFPKLLHFYVAHLSQMKNSPSGSCNHNIKAHKFVLLQHHSDRKHLKNYQCWKLVCLQSWCEKPYCPSSSSDSRQTASVTSSGSSGSSSGTGLVRPMRAHTTPAQHDTHTMAWHNGHK